MIDFYSIGAKIKYYRTQKHIPQGQFADTIGISRQHLRNIENSGKATTLETLVCIANNLELTLDDLLVDSLQYKTSIRGNDIDILLVDCSPEEVSILMQNMNDLKLILKKYRIK